MKITSRSPLEDDKTLGDCGFTSQNAKIQEPTEIALCLKLVSRGIEYYLCVLGRVLMQPLGCKNS